MMTYTAYDPETLEQWCSDKTNFQLFDSALQDYLQIFSDQFHAKSQKKYFSTLIKGFFSHWTVNLWNHCLTVPW